MGFEVGLCDDQSTCVIDTPSEALPRYVCWPGETGRVGDACADEYTCGRGLFCQPWDHRCASACNATSDCGSGLYCGEHRCQPPCTSYTQCPPGYACYSGFCTNDAAFSICSPGAMACAPGTVCGGIPSACVDESMAGCLAPGFDCRRAGTVCVGTCVSVH